MFFRRLEVGIRGNLLRLMKIYFSGRTFQVVCEGAKSVSRSKSAGVCQASCLGPVLWLIYLAGIRGSSVENDESTRIYTFADDHSIKKSTESRTCSSADAAPK